MRRLSLLFVVVLVVLLPTIRGATAAAEQRVALVIGNGNYASAPKLANPMSDAKLMADTLRGLGFEIVGGSAQLDLDKRGMEIAIRNFSHAIGGRTIAVFYYSGHGLQIQGTNYLVPVDAKLESSNDADFDLLDAGVVLRQMGQARSSLNIVILDACRNNPLAGRGLRDATQGLAEMSVPRGTLISYSTQPGGVARDGDPGGNSPYTQALAEVMKTPGLDVVKAFNLVGLKVGEATGNAQLPWVSTSPIDGDFFLAGTSAPSAPPANATPPPAVVQTYADRDALFWQSVQNSTHAAEFEQYLEKFPDGTFSSLARTRLALLQPPRPPSRNTAAPTDDTLTRAETAEAQSLLTAMGLDAGEATGTVGPRTYEMVRAFQRAVGLPETGVLTRASLERLRGAPPSPQALAQSLYDVSRQAAASGRKLDAERLCRAGERLDPKTFDTEAAPDPSTPHAERPASGRGINHVPNDSAVAAAGAACRRLIASSTPPDSAPSPPPSPRTQSAAGARTNSEATAAPKPAAPPRPPPAAPKPPEPVPVVARPAAPICAARDVQVEISASPKKGAVQAGFYRTAIKMGQDGTCGFTATQSGLLPLGTIWVQSAPTSGAVRIEGGRVTYRPRPGFVGADSFMLGTSPRGWISVEVSVQPSS